MPTKLITAGKIALTVAVIGGGAIVSWQVGTYVGKGQWALISKIWNL